MNIFKRLTEKPWQDDGTVVELRTASYAASNQKVALVLFLAIVGVLFSLFFAAYHMRLEPLEFGAGVSSDWQPMPEPPLMWFNTLVLALASVAYEWARRTAARGELGTAKLTFLLAGAATFAFLVLQLVVWNQMVARGYYAYSNPANSFFYLITAVHGVHLLGGLIAWGRAAGRLRTAEDDPERLKRSIDLCALYWHFLLLIWLGMLALFVNT
jgi:cytochrome c oxidase subunit 3